MIKSTLCCCALLGLLLAGMYEASGSCNNVSMGARVIGVEELSKVRGGADCWVLSITACHAPPSTSCLINGVCADNYCVNYLDLMDMSRVLMNWTQCTPGNGKKDCNTDHDTFCWDGYNCTSECVMSLGNYVCVMDLDTETDLEPKNLWFPEGANCDTGA